MSRNADLAPFSAARSFEAAARHHRLSTASAGEHILIGAQIIGIIQYRKRLTWVAGLDPWAFSPRASFVGIHGPATVLIGAEERVDHRVEPGDDEYEQRHGPAVRAVRTNN